MPRQNRVDPWSNLVATPARGALMGNRGCLHDPSGRIVRTHALQRWILCRLTFKGRRRPVMTPGHYTELFFLDEATALAAGHRPCAECLRERFNRFRRAWATANPQLSEATVPTAVALDTALHAERLQAGKKATYPARLGDLPPGVFVVLPGADDPYLVGQARLWRWSFTGYTPAPVWDGELAVILLTPPSVVRTLAAGYLVQTHPSAADSAFAGRAALDFNAP
jgi:hypothetical protein